MCSVRARIHTPFFFHSYMCDTSFLGETTFPNTFMALELILEHFRLLTGREHTSHQEFYKQGFGITSKIWFLCTLEFTVHSALFEPVWFVVVLQVSTQHFLFRFSISLLRSISSLPCLQTARNKAECTVNSKVQKDQILGATPYPCRRQL